MLRGPALQRAEHLFGLDHEVYGEPLELRLHARLRDERTFPGLDALKEQLHRDREAAQAALNALSAS